MYSFRSLHNNVWTFRRSVVWTFLGSLIPWMGAVAAFGQVPEKPVVRQGEITSNDVYVRSGSSMNHYPVGKLEAGDRVTIVGQTGDWYELLPPEGTFSFISGDYVDTVNDQTGVVNGDRVRVRAGSRLPEFSKLKYVIQTKLSKGAEVTIVGRDPDGFLRIKPPAGVTVWVNRGYIELLPETLATPEGETGRPTADSTDESADDGAEAVPEDATVAVFTALPKTPQRRTLDELDALARAELEKPVLERQFAPLMERYRALAQQQKDDFAQRYAEARVEQLANMTALVDTIRVMQQLDEEAESKRREFLERRAKIREMLPPIPTGLDAQGVLRVSALYPPGSLPRRYRLVDPTGSHERTLGYVEFPPDSAIEVDSFLDRYVGVRASSRRLQTGGVEPVPIYVVGELVLLQPTTSTIHSPDNKS